MAKSKQQVDYSYVPETLDGHPFYGFQLDPDQREFVNNIWDDKKKIIVCNARAGAGKTQMAFAAANLLYKYGKFPSGIIYVVSPYGEAKQGFLPGDITEKSEVYFEPLYQAIIKCNEIPEQIIYNESLIAQNDKQRQAGYVKCITHTFTRGTNFEDAVVILDESQNYSFDDLKKTLTRISDSCKVIVIGHNEQKDTDDDTNGFIEYYDYLKELMLGGEERIAVCELTVNHRGWISSITDALHLQKKQNNVSSETLKLIKG